uniref:Uncharacterized protein n=1 Tax=Oryza punctata TaxID=4537 RepID=A0A0E0MFS1_ORYPU
MAIDGAAIVLLLPLAPTRDAIGGEESEEEEEEEEEGRGRLTANHRPCRLAVDAVRLLAASHHWTPPTAAWAFGNGDDKKEDGAAPLCCLRAGTFTSLVLNNADLLPDDSGNHPKSSPPRMAPHRCAGLVLVTSTPLVNDADLLPDDGGDRPKSSGY